jgi:glutamate racemase
LGILKNKPIGVFDSGIGGLSVLKQFVRFLPAERYIYLGDTARVPYGNKSDDTVRRYSRECTNFLLDHDVKLIVVACNTASSVALDAIREISKVPVIGMIVPAAGAAIRATANSRIGVIGTRATINSNAYVDAIYNLSHNKEIRVYSKACPLFVPLAEEGMLRHEATRIIAAEYLEELKSEHIDTLVLGCTHYPLLSQLISEIMPGVSLIDSGEHSTVTAIRLLAEKDALADEKKEFVSAPDVELFVTDISGSFYDIASRFLGFSIDKIHKVSIGQ